MLQGSPVMFGMRVLHCQEPPGLELFGHAPQFNANNFSHVFKHGSRYEQGDTDRLGWSTYCKRFQQVEGPSGGLLWTLRNLFGCQLYL